MTIMEKRIVQLTKELKKWAEGIFNLLSRFDAEGVVSAEEVDNGTHDLRTFEIEDENGRVFVFWIDRFYNIVGIDDKTNNIVLFTDCGGVE